MSGPKKILMLTNAEHGQANVFLATAHEILQVDPEVEVHVCSFPALESSVDSIRVLNKSADSRLSFIKLAGPSWKQALFGRPEHQFQELNDIRPTIWNVARAAKLTRIACPWTSGELCNLVTEIEKIIEDLNPALTIVDNLFTPAVTVCYKVKPHWMVLSPNTYKEFALANQPNQQYYWKYPPPRSTIAFPVPWYQMPLVYYMVRTMYLNHNDPFMLSHAREMKAAIDTDYADWAYISIVPPPGLQILLASRPEVDFPFDVKPAHMIPCGPIIRPAPPVAEADPELAKWLARRPTVLVNLGTHASYDAQHARGMAGALDRMLKEAKGKGEALQVLWKLNGREGEDVKLEEFTGRWGDAVKVVKWLDVEPSSILESGHVACSVNHGGANSFFEAISAGVPQVVLPVWGDTYDFAKRAEWLGVGRFGSWKHAPKVDEKELGGVLKDVVLGPKAASFKAKAAELAALCKKEGGGRRVAAKTILAALDDKGDSSDE
ncbi:3-hydroxyacid dehydrogenase/reductase [Cordyceps fumosorosea ARSEF 2679]|uniref:3-hydroxyacid dehydrogenase/reductase n=1 Tax=Cordyceps fumosorosea (strain ARSEF 2679) TaxID=1081104 RepID=A0A167I8I0_CORFA|nr:3-hydroxyacid dehydrogenase/reductase [Cordyceps fumosorosea ARSEF 2679]OAA48786.1 3-hydroxyacid dehydrogenase/reductase [Cordyceps fumosorosea ARSEF 2679]